MKGRVWDNYLPRKFYLFIGSIRQFLIKSQRFFIVFIRKQKKKNRVGFRPPLFQTALNRLSSWTFVLHEQQHKGRSNNIISLNSLNIEIESSLLEKSFSRKMEIVSHLNPWSVIINKKGGLRFRNRRSRLSMSCWCRTCGTYQFAIQIHVLVNKVAKDAYALDQSSRVEA